MKIKFFQILAGAVIIMATLIGNEESASAAESCPKASKLITPQLQNPITIATSVNCKDLQPTSGFPLEAANVPSFSGGQTTLSNDPKKWAHYTYKNPSGSCSLMSYVYFKLSKQTTKHGTKKCVYDVCTSWKPCDEKGACNTHATCKSPGKITLSENSDGCEKVGQSCICNNTDLRGMCNTGSYKNGIYCQCPNPIPPCRGPHCRP